MKIFIDTADVKEIREANSMGVIDGVTTNPTLAAKSGRNYVETLKEICSIIDGPISAETISLDKDGMMKEAYAFRKIHNNIVVKIPMTVEGLKAVKQCTTEGIPTNVTVVFTANQALLCAKAGATFVSPFVGRLDDVSTYGMEVIRQIRQIYNNFGFRTQILTASVRHPVHVLEAALMGSDVVTCPLSVITQLVKHPLTDIGVQKFLDDWKKVPK
ncbi:MAG: fructose-6-phosphate aldolase [Deltaproteobacteria bacterium]|nr:fructose-6-phosphate aldolase [Deltaproteobacteria bacterium]